MMNVVTPVAALVSRAWGTRWAVEETFDQPASETVPAASAADERVRLAEDPVIAAVAAHHAALAAVDAALRTDHDEREVVDAMRRADALLCRVLATPPRSIPGLSVLLCHVTRHEWDDPEGPTILAGAQEAGDDSLRKAAENFLAGLAVAVLAIGHP
jgi:hypothetical protein